MRIYINGVLTPAAGGGLPAALAAGEVPISSGAGTTYTAGALSASGLDSARPAAAEAFLGRTYYSTDVFGGALYLCVTDGGGNYGWEQINDRPRVVQASSNVNADQNEVLICDAAGGAFTVSLLPMFDGAMVSVKRVNSGVNAVTIDADGGELIDGAGTLVLSTQYAAVTLWSDGTGWWVF